MPYENWVGIIILLALSAYSVLGMADFGGGVWDLLATGPRAGQQRQAISKAMGPVWEANHVWLIFFLILLVACFPHAYAVLSTALFVPFHLVLAGIVMRGTAFVFRSPETRVPGSQRFWGISFGIASLITPFLLGAALGAASAGGIRFAGNSVTVNPATSWLSPFSVGVGSLVLALAAFLAAVFLAAETEGDLRGDFQRRALIAGRVTAVFAALVLILMAHHVPWLWQRFTHEPLVILLLIAGMLLALLSLVLIGSGHFYLARVTASGHVIVLLWGWSIAQWPYLVYPDITLDKAKAADAVLRFVLQIMPLGMLILLPSLWLLFRVFKHSRLPEANSQPGDEND